MRQGYTAAMSLATSAVAAPVEHRVAIRPVSHAALRCVAIPAAPATPSRLFDLQGVKLEKSLDDFRAMAHPDGTDVLGAFRFGDHDSINGWEWTAVLESSVLTAP